MASRLLQAARRVPGWWRARSLLLPGLAALHRRRLDGVIFVAVTGSAGKTTTKILATAVLSTAGRIRPWAGTINNLDHIMAVVLATKPRDDFCVIEFSAGRPGALDRSLATVRPRIGVVTKVGSDHLKAFHSVEAIAEEKAKVVACLPADGIAVLNADDPLVLAMASRCQGRIITFGLGPEADLRAEQVRAAWPERLAFTARYQGRSVEIITQLCGTHWTTAVLAALAVGIAASIPLEQAARAVAMVEPYPSRMYPMTKPVTKGDGVTFIVDDWKSSLWTLPSTFDFLLTARARRKVVVIGTLSDYGGSAATAYKRVATAALEAADHVVFVGPMATLALRARQDANADRLRAFGTIRDAADFLGALLQEGDLVAIKGSMNFDHLGRLAHHWMEPITCWSMACRKNMPCSSCKELRAAQRAEPQQDPAAPLARADADQGRAGLALLPGCTGPFEVIVGIGNPGPRYRGTPHNVGAEVVDTVAKRLGLAWTTGGDFAWAHTRLPTKTLVLLKPRQYVNNTGGCLKRLADDLGFAAEDCVLVQDDIHLPLGKLRQRARGSDGGHKGVRSALVAFQSDALRRLKIGVAPAIPSASAASYLTAPFTAEAAALVAPAIEAAADRLLERLEDGIIKST